MTITVDFSSELIEVADQVDVDCQELINAIREAEASATGIANDQIAEATGKASLGAGVSVGITIELLGNWQLHFAEEVGGYIAKIGGGNLVGGPGSDPVAYTSGVQVLLIQSAASTIVSASGAIPTAEENAAAVLAAAATAPIHADAKRMNGYPVGGDGTPENKWTRG